MPSLKQLLAGTGAEVAAGDDAVVEAAKRPADVIVSAIVGAAGLAPTLAACDQGTVVALANKESLVCAGEVALARAKNCWCDADAGRFRTFRHLSVL